MVTNRRPFLYGLGVGLLAASAPSLPNRRPSSTESECSRPAPTDAHPYDAFKQAMREQGYVARSALTIAYGRSRIP